MNKSLLKWAGGKSRIAEDIKRLLPSDKTRLVEPFAGSCSFSLNCDFKQYLIADINKDLIGLYLELKKREEKFIDLCKSFFDHKDADTLEHYKTLRDIFNLIKKNNATPDTKAALFVYLNRHCFNGLCRYNSKGEFNVPFGKYENPYFPRKEMLEFIKFSKKSVFVCQKFEDTFEELRADDCVYADPPYVPISDTANFTAYSSDGFSEEDHRKLAKLSKEAPCPVIISNHDVPLTREIYSEADDMKTIDVSRHISSDGSKRKSVKEVLILYNYKGVKSKEEEDLEALFG